MKNVKVERLDRFDNEKNAWQEAVVVDTPLAPVPDIVSFRVDFADWLRRLSTRNRRVAAALSVDNRTQEVSRWFGLSESRVSALRRELAASWRQFVGDVPAKAA